MSLSIIYILISVLLGASGQILLKKGMVNMGPLTLTLNDFPVVVLRMVTSPFILIGLSIYLLGTVFWLTALSRVDLSYAYPFASLSYIIMLIASWMLFDEHITPLRLAGTAIIAIGVFLISRS